ncbi:hypothetical protein [Streptomyces niphimycinicus]|nr:hypothetical protein [Streptomyces niphimycinicus]
MPLHRGVERGRAAPGPGEVLSALTGAAGRLARLGLAGAGAGR